MRIRVHRPSARRRLRRGGRALAAVILVAAVVIIAAVSTRTGHEVGSDLGLTADRTFAVRLGGGLYEARTLHDEGGAADVAYLTADAPLRVGAGTGDGAGIAAIRVRVDDGRALVRAMPCARGCPKHVSVTLLPRVLAAGPGTHRVIVEAVRAAPQARPARIGSFAVRVGRAGASPAELEGAAARDDRPVDLTRAAPGLDGAVRSAAAHGVLARLLGPSHLRLRERGVGAGLVTVAADVVPARRGVTAVLPQPGGDEPARMHATVLRDVLLDVNRRTGRLVAVQPGPASAIASWAPTSPSGAPVNETGDDAPSAAFSPTRRPHLRKLSDRGPAFFTEDGDPNLRADGRDWPLSLVFAGAATVPKVKRALRTLGLTRTGHSRSLGYRLRGSELLRFDGDRGLKAACDANATDVHVRLYAPTATDAFRDPQYGSVVLGTAHLDHVDGCGQGPSLFGFSERAERQVAALVATRLHWRVQVDALSIGNAETLRRDTKDPGHVWLADGAATVITVP